MARESKDQRDDRAVVARTPGSVAGARATGTGSGGNAGARAGGSTPSLGSMYNTPGYRQAQEAIALGRVGTAMNVNQGWQQGLGAQMMPPPGAPPEAPRPIGPGGGGRGGGGGGAAGPSLAELQGMADQQFTFNNAPYDAMRAATQGQRDRTNAYNPDFAAMEQEYAGRARGIEGDRAAMVQQRLDALAGFGSQLAGQQGTAIGAAMRDIGAQGGTGDAYMAQANAIGGDRTAMLANQGQYMGQLNANSANSLADSLRSSGLIAQGGQATLANNRGTLLNQLGQQDVATQLQQSNAQQANDLAKREFMLKYGVA